MAAPFPSPTKVWHDNTYSSISPLRPELSTKGKTILITGGGTGIGAETARSFAQAGASRIALLGRRLAPLLETKASILSISPSTDVFVSSTDITDQASVDKVFEEFIGNGKGKIDILISNAAVAGPQQTLATADTNLFLASINTNITGAYNIAQAFLRHSAKNAVVIETNSSVAHLDLGGVFAAYAISKFAVFKLWDAVKGAEEGLSVFHTQPGVVDTEMNREVGGVEKMGFEDHVSLPANFYVWLASEEAKFLNGKFVWANWDVDELKGMKEEIAKRDLFTLGLVGWPFEGDAGFKMDQFK